ncbi:hypothetical protein RBXJA2T_14676 [Rubrivivax benzoatilyticus JA2 = ATCC BAA-35]|nr:hypothetical protein RBXJA2T_14676 [Rubrivivax benzoatilyticus JA2 = ATCC BAA-35]
MVLSGLSIGLPDSIVPTETAPARHEGDKRQEELHGG